MKSKKLLRPTPKEDREINEGIAADPENPEWTEKDFRNAMSAGEFFKDGLPGVRGPQKAPTKIRTTVRFSPEVIETYKGLGRGWQTRMNQDLQELVGLKYKQIEKDGELVTVERRRKR